MKLVGFTMSYQSEWVVGLSVRAMLRYCDEVVVGYQPSTDGTRDILAAISDEAPGRLHIVMQDVEPGMWVSWERSRRDELLQFAAARGATHFAIFDEDEVLTDNLVSGVRALIDPNEIVWLPWLSMWDSPDIWTRIWLQRLPFFYRRNERSSYIYTTHTRCPGGYPFDPETPPQIAYGAGGVMHLQFVSRRRLDAKRTLYRLMHKVQFPDAGAAGINEHYSQAMTPPAPHEVEAVPDGWWAGLEDLRCHLHPELPPWQEALCRDLVSRHGRAFFDGLAGLQGVA